MNVIRYSIILLSLSLITTGCFYSDVKNNQNLEKDVESSSEVYSVEKEKMVKIEDKFKLPILLFHHIGNDTAGLSDSAKTWYVSVEKFAEILGKIEELGYKPIFLSEFLDYLEVGEMPEKSLVISFDDGTIDFYTDAWPILKKYNFKSSVNLMTGVRGENYLDKEKILELDKTGLVEFQSHTVYHAYLTMVGEEELLGELQKSKKYIEDLLNKKTEIIAYPFGLYNEAVSLKAKDLGYKLGLTIKSGVWQDKNNLMEMKRNIITENTEIIKILDL